MKTLITSALLAGALLAATGASASSQSHYFSDKPDWARSAFLDGTQR